MKSTTKSAPKGVVPDFDPHLNVARKYFETGAGAMIERNRWFFVSCILAATVAGQSLAINMLFPLKTVETIQVVKTDGGRLTADGEAIGNWQPDQDSITYFLNRWANNVYDVNRATVEGTIRDASEMTVGTASTQLRELRVNDNPLVKLQNFPGYNRSYEFISCNPIQDGVDLLRFKTITRDGGDPKINVYAMRITYTRVKPTKIEQIVKNPAGLYITSFNITEEANQK